MKLDLYHNKIVADTITPEFEESLVRVLLPLIKEKYGVVEVIQMYEDYIADGFIVDGYAYYPFTLVRGGEVITQWVRWPYDRACFEDGLPYSYMGSSDISFELCDDAPVGFEEKLAGRARYFEGECVKLRVDTVGGDSSILLGRYSQTFIDEMARQLTGAIEAAMGISGVAGSSVELVMMFSTDTFMEHTCDNVTYRRLRLLDKVSAPRDFWIQWTRLDGAVAHSVSSHVTAENIKFELGEDVEQKIREKEYRYLLASNNEKYHNSMGRKKVTEWREVIKRAVKRGELTKIETDLELAPETLELEELIADILGKSPADRGGYEKEEIPYIHSDDSDFDKAMQKMRMVVEDMSSEEDDAVSFDAADDEDCFDEPEEELFVDEPDDDIEEVEQTEEIDMPEENYDNGQMITEPEEAEVEDAILYDEEENTSVYESLIIPEVDTFDLEEETDEYADNILEEDDENLETEEEISVLEEEAAEEEVFDEEILDDEEIYEEKETNLDKEELSEIEEDLADEDTLDAKSPEEPYPHQMPTPIADRAADIRAEIETKIRLECEIRAHEKTKEELVTLRRERDRLKMEIQAIRAEAMREQERLRLEYEHLVHQTERDAAMRKAEEAQRRAEEEQLRIQIEAQLRAEAKERERYAEAARMAMEEKHRLEAENARIARQREEEERIEEEKRRKEQEERELEALRQAELERIRREEEEAKERARTAMPDMGDGRYSYTSKSVKLIFRRSVDPNITTRIYEIIKTTVDYYSKDRVYLKIRASVPDSQSVVLDFEHIPLEEMELLGNIIKILGNSGLGIAKAIIE